MKDAGLVGAAPPRRVERSRSPRLPSFIAELICSYRDPLYEQVRLKGGTPSALALKHFEVANLKLEPWCNVPQTREFCSTSIYWIHVTPLHPGLWVCTLSWEVWSRQPGGDWADNIYEGNETLEEHDKRCAWLQAELLPTC